MKQSTYRKMKSNLVRLINNLLLEHAAGLRRLTVAEVVALFNVLNAEKPTAYAIQNVLVNELTYLVTYNTTPDARAVISDFLKDFQNDCAESMLAAEKTVKDGLTLKEGLES